MYYFPETFPYPNGIAPLVFGGISEVRLQIAFKIQSSFDVLEKVKGLCLQQLYARNLLGL